MSYERTITEAIPLPVTRKPPAIDEPMTTRVCPVDAPTLTLRRDGLGWVSEDGMFHYPSTLHMFADWQNGVNEIPDPSPFEAAASYFSERTLPYDIGDVTQAEWDAARVIVEEVKSGVFAPASA